MTVLSSYSVTLEVPDLRDGNRFYSDAGFAVREQGNRLLCQCPGQNRESIVLVGGAKRKRLHHISLKADPDGFDDARKKATEAGGEVIPAPPGFDAPGLWLRDPHGMIVHLVDAPTDPPLEAQGPFTINEPGRTPRKNSSAMLPRNQTPSPVPLRLGHILVFTPDVMASVKFFTQALGMGLADRAQDVIAFCCARSNSDHHVVAFAKSPGVGFHHASFMLADPDQVGRAGAALKVKSGRGEWGFGRHTIGSNFFHYVQDPWGSWFEYYSDMDFIEDYALWTPRNYDMEDSLANWGPAVPEDFVHNYEVDEKGFTPPPS